jgi:hypothetical protein
MKKLFSCLLLFFLILFCASSVSAFDPEELNSITFHNKTGYDIYYIFLSPGDSEYWGPEILGANWVLGADESLGFYIHYPDYTNNFDIMAIDDDGYTFVIWDYPVSDDAPAEIVFEFDDLLDDPPEFEFITLEVTNTTAYPMYFLFISPEDSRMWGVDLFDENTILMDGETFPLLVPVGSDTATYNVLAVDEGLGEYQFDVHLNSRYADDEGIISVAIEPADLLR